jgi:hypothetical protein
MHNEDLAIGTFRHAISKLIPDMTRVALISRRKEIVRDTPNFNEREFLHHLSRAQYQKEWGNGYRKPGFGIRLLALFLKIVPKVGSFKAMAFKIPTTQTEDMYIKSVNKTVDDYGALLRQQKQAQLRLADMDFDTAVRLALENIRWRIRPMPICWMICFDLVTSRLRQNILSFYADPSVPIATKKNTKA